MDLDYKTNYHPSARNNDGCYDRASRRLLSGNFRQSSQQDRSFTVADRVCGHHGADIANVRVIQGGKGYTVDGRLILDIYEA